MRRLLLAEHRQHALRHREAAEHVDRRERDARPPTASGSTRWAATRSAEILRQVGRDLHQRADRDDAADTALVTLISGVCSAGFTFHTTM